MSNNLRHRVAQITHQPPGNAADVMNIVLLGKTGVGKSSAANTILGENRFICKRSMNSVIHESKAESKVIDGTNVKVIDTPGFFDNTLSEEQLAQEFAKSMYLSAPGVHAFLFVVPFGRFTEQEEDIVKRIEKVFGGNVMKNVIILFTYGDECDHETVESEIKQNEFMKKVKERCQGYHIFNNKELNNREQVTALLQKINALNSSGYYTHEMYEWAQKNTFERFWYYVKPYCLHVVEFLLGKINSFSGYLLQQTKFALNSV